MAVLVTGVTACADDPPGSSTARDRAAGSTSRTVSTEPVLGAEVARPRPPRPKLPHLSAAQLAGQHVIFAFDGTVAPPELLDRIRRAEAAGVILFRRNIATPEQVSALTASLHAAARQSAVKARLIVMVDEEGGQITRMPWLRLPSAAQLGRAGDPDLAYESGRATGQALRRLGVTVNLAPVADVARRRSVLERYERTYSREPAAVAALASRFAGGLGDAGVGATAKHFPGFGSARRTTDRRTVVIRRSVAELDAVDGPPFAALMREGVPLVMTSTAVYPELSTRPAALSETVVKGRLRGSLGFNGVVVTDDLETPATLPLGPPESLAEAAVAAGNDLVIFAKTYSAGERAAEGIQTALVGGLLTRGELRQSAARVIELRRSLSHGARR
jgi:beta-N-acetylhexosaminidase